MVWRARLLEDEVNTLLSFQLLKFIPTISTRNHGWKYDKTRQIMEKQSRHDEVL